MDEALTSLLRRLAKVATKLIPRKVMEGEIVSLLESHFGGQPYAEIGEAWPSCPVCNTDLTLICQIDVTSGFHEKPNGIDLFTFFYCWECGPWGLDDEIAGTWVVRTYSDPKEIFAEPIRPSGPEAYPPDVCRLVSEKVNSFPDYDEIDSRFEKKTAESFSDIDEPWDAYEAAVKSLGGETEFCTLVGGYAHWIQSDGTPVCDHCQSRMNLLAQLDSEREPDLMWGDSGCLYLFYCASHPRDVRLQLQCF
jgi:uncharacterized protein YwqG